MRVGDKRTRPRHEIEGVRVDVYKITIIKVITTLNRDRVDGTISSSERTSSRNVDRGEEEVRDQ